MADYFSFEDVMGELEVSEDDLKRMVSEGELRAFRDENKMKFRKEDVENLKKGRITEPTIILPSTPGGGQDETVLDLDISTETASFKSGGQDISAADTATGDDDLLINTDSSGEDESVVGLEADDTFIEEGESDTGLTTEPLQLADEVEAAETVESEPVTEEIAEPARGRSRVGKRVTAQIPMATEEEIERRRASPVWTIFMLLALVAGLYSGITAFDLLRMENGLADQPSALTQGMAKWTLDQFWGDAKWVEFHTSEFPEGGHKQPPYNVSAFGVEYPHREYKGPTFMESDIPGATPNVGQ